MKELRDTIVSWVDQRMDDMLSAPRMWGSDEAVELQMLLLLELRALALRPEELTTDPRRILDAYAAYVAKTYPKTPNLPLSQIVATDHLGLELAAALRKFREQMAKQYKAEKTSTTQPATSKPPKSHSSKNVPHKNPWQKFDMISQGLHAPPRLMSGNAGGLS